MWATLVTFNLKENCTFDQFSTDDFEIWRDALTKVASQKGWSEFWWGRRIGDESRVELLIEWDDESAAFNFSKSAPIDLYQHLEPILAHQPSQPPAIADFPSLGCLPTTLGPQVTALYRLRFPPLELQARQGFGVQANLFGQEMSPSLTGGGEPTFNGSVQAWVKNDLSEGAGESESAKSETEKVETFVIMNTWRTVEDEKKFEKTTLLEGYHRTAYEELLLPVIINASRGYDKCLVIWSFVTDFNLEEWRNTGKVW